MLGGASPLGFPRGLRSRRSGLGLPGVNGLLTVCSLQISRVMKHRWAIGAGITVVVVAGAYWLLPPGHGTAATTARRSAKVAVRPLGPGEAPAEAAPAAPKLVMTEHGLQPQTTRKTPREWVDPRNGAVNREILDAVPDPEGAAREQLEYRKSRLRLTLADNAAPCWTGGDSKEEIELEYTLVVDKEVIRTDNVRVKSSNLTNPSVERCIIDSVRDLRSFGDKIPDLRENQGLVMSLHDLYDRNARDTQNAAGDKAAADKPTAIDRPTAKPPGE